MKWSLCVLQYLEMRFDSRAARLVGTLVIVALQVYTKGYKFMQHSLQNTRISSFNRSSPFGSPSRKKNSELPVVLSRFVPAHWQVLYMGVALYSPATALEAGKNSKVLGSSEEREVVVVAPKQNMSFAILHLCIANSPISLFLSLSLYFRPLIGYLCFSDWVPGVGLDCDWWRSGDCVHWSCECQIPACFAWILSSSQPRLFFIQNERILTLWLEHLYTGFRQQARKNPNMIWCVLFLQICMKQPAWGQSVAESGTFSFLFQGGMKASIYASVLQTILMAAGVLAVIIKASGTKLRA